VPRCFIASNQRQTATKSPALCCRSVVPSLFAVGLSGLLPKIQAAENILANRQVSTPPTKTQPKVLASCAKLSLCFEAIQGQVSGVVKLLARGRRYPLFLQVTKLRWTCGKAFFSESQPKSPPSRRRGAGYLIFSRFGNAGAISHSEWRSRSSRRDESSVLGQACRVPTYKTGRRLLPVFLVVKTAAIGRFL
jgi:hypothetical protein